MKRFIYYLFITALFFCLTTNISAQTSSFPVGEKLTYNITFGTFSDAAYVELHCVGKEKLNEKDVYVVRAKVRTGGTVQATLLDLNNDYTAFLSPENGLPVRIERFLRDDGKNTDVRRDFAENQTVSDANVHDLISALYQIRQFNLTEKVIQPIKVWENERVYDAKLQIVGRETMATSMGAMNVYAVQVKTNDDAFNRYQAKIHFSDDERRLPVMINLKLPQGVLRADLASVQMITPEPVAVVVQPTPIPQPTVAVRPTPRPTPAPRPYVDNQPLDISLPFALGEELTFDVLRNNQKIGVIRLQVKDRKQHFGRDSVMLSATAQTANNSGFFTGGDKIESYVHPDFIVPFRHEIRLSSQLAGFNQLLIFDQELGYVTNNQTQRMEVPVGTHDVLSFIYALRAFRYSFVKNADAKAAIFLGGVPIVVNLKPAREVIDFNGQKVNTIALTATTENPQIDSLNLRLWLSDDSRRLPLKLTFNSPQGVIQANLVSF